MEILLLSEVKGKLIDAWSLEPMALLQAVPSLVDKFIFEEG